MVRLATALASVVVIGTGKRTSWAVLKLPPDASPRVNVLGGGRVRSDGDVRHYGSAGIPADDRLSSAPLPEERLWQAKRKLQSLAESSAMFLIGCTLVSLIGRDQGSVAGMSGRATDYNRGLHVNALGHSPANLSSGS